ncbi:methyltransferase [Lysobacter enzymogenes]|uniref:methyltransferase n=1 Tax=Lysobacter enzymogenes TaxID=69 RepID=UPI001AF78391|nr:methyltransferase [Lysobacter enzymogenes]QQQ02816.1 hypothetical protein JHW41_07555 [Lysobacter enzymogenes]
MRTASSESSSSQRPLGPAQLAASGAFARALAVAARLGLADLTATQARTSAELAAQTGTDPQTLALLLRTLAMAGVFDIDGEGRFGLSEAYQPLRGDHPQSQRHVCILVAETYDDAFAGLLETVRSGRSGFRPALGTSLYDYLAAHPDAEAIFDEAMAELARPVARAIAARPGFAEAAMAIDIGGGSGAFLRGLLDAHPHLRGICLDRPSVCARAAQRAVGGDARLEFRAADVFSEIPAGGDLYLVKNVLYDWSFDSGLKLLTAARAAMAQTAAAEPGRAAPRLLVVEPLFERESDAPRALFQKVICEDGTRGLDEAQLRRLIEAARLRVLGVERLETGHSVFECAP